MSGKDAAGHDEWHSLNVAEACAGMRSLMTFISVGGAVAFLSMRPLWQKVLITLSAIPIAIFCNVMRVSGQGLLDRYVSHLWSQGFAHQFAGIVMLVPGFLLILAVGWFLDQIFVEVADEAPRPKRSLVKVGTEPANWSLQRLTPPTGSKTKAPTAAPAKPVNVPVAPANKPMPALAAKPRPKTAVATPAQPAKPAAAPPAKAALKEPAAPVPPAAPRTPAPPNIRRNNP
jgi:exosortase/archaeosortase family protein